MPTEPEPANAGVLDCAWLRGQNCWKATLAAATCLPTGTGTFTPDALSCAYPGGAEVTFFRSPRESGAENWDFSVTVNGQSCVRLRQVPYRTEITTSAGTVVRATATTGNVFVVCPDGSAYVQPKELAWRCGTLDPEFEASFLGYSNWFGNPADAPFGYVANVLGADTAGGMLPLFDCRYP